MDQFLHVRALLGIILGLSIAHMITGGVRLIEHPNRSKSYWVHLLWAFYVFLLIIHFWWWQFELHTIQQWNFLKYLFLVIYTILFFVNAYVLFPKDLDDYDGYKDYFYYRRNWFFGVLAAIFLLDVIDSWAKGTAHLQSLGIEYLVAIAIQVILSIAAIFTRNKKFHAFLVIAFIVYRLLWIFRLYYTMPS